MSVDRVVLRRCPVPTDYLCACGKVARELRKAGIDAEEVRVPLRKGARDEVLRLTGQTSVPVIESDGLALCDSKRIIEWITANRPAAEAGPASTSD